MTVLIVFIKEWENYCSQFVGSMKITFWLHVILILVALWHFAILPFVSIPWYICHDLVGNVVNYLVISNNVIFWCIHVNTVGNVWCMSTIQLQLPIFSLVCSSYPMPILSVLMFCMVWNSVMLWDSVDSFIFSIFSYFYLRYWIYSLAYFHSNGWALNHFIGSAV